MSLQSSLLSNAKVSLTLEKLPFEFLRKVSLRTSASPISDLGYNGSSVDFALGPALPRALKWFVRVSHADLGTVNSRIGPPVVLFLKVLLWGGGGQYGRVSVRDFTAFAS